MKLVREEVDHKDRNRLNAQRENLRAATISQNRTNRITDTASGFRGVSWHKKTKCWRVSITVNGKTRSFGYFHDSLEAVKHYDKIAPTYLGEFVFLNFPEEKSSTT